MSHQAVTAASSTDHEESASSESNNNNTLAPPPLLPRTTAANANPLMNYFDSEEDQLHESEGGADDGSAVMAGHKNEEVKNNDHENGGGVVLSLQNTPNEEETKNNEDRLDEVDGVKEDTSSEGNNDDTLLNIGEEIGSSSSSNNNDIADRQQQQNDSDDSNEANDSASSITIHSNNDQNITTSPSTSPPTLPSTSNTTNNDPTTLSPGSQTLLAEAERQAAIAAAISANMSSSPSAAGNIAKYMMKHKNVTSLNNHNSPTVVDLPPLSPVPLQRPLQQQQQQVKQKEQLVGERQQRQRVMKPVRFEEVRIAFDNIVNEKSCDEIMTKGGDGSCGSDSAGNEEEKVVNESSTEEEAAPATTQLIDVETKTEMETPLSSKTSTTTALPDSFLRFLLLLANVPIIIEEGEKSPKRGAAKASSDDNDTSTSAPKPAVIDAAQRAYELYTLAQNTYDSISERQLQSQQSGRRGDATATFFAACSGEIGEVYPTAEIVNDSGGKGRGDDKSGSGKRVGHLPTAVAVAVNPRNVPQKQQGRGSGGVPPSPPTSSSSSSSPILSIPTSSASAAAAVASASAVFSNVMSKVTKKQSSFSSIGKKFMSSSSGSVLSTGGDRSNLPRKLSDSDQKNGGKINIIQNDEEGEEEMLMTDYEVTIDQEMLGLTVENVLERTIIRTLLPNGAAIHAGAKVGSLIAKVGNVDTSNLTHFETIDELRQSQRPLRLSLRYISSDILRSARGEMGRLIRGRIDPLSTSSEDEMEDADQSLLEESFDSVLRHRWPSLGGGPSSSMMKMSSSSSAPAAMTRADLLHHAGKDLIRILTLLVVGMEKELVASVKEEEDCEPHLLAKQHLSSKELNEALEITSKILLEYSRGHSEIEGRRGGGTAGMGRQIGSSSFYPVPPGRVQGKKQKGKGKGGKKSGEESPLLRIGDALQRTRFFLVETSSITATVLRWEIIDYLCKVLDLDTEQELSEKEAASATGSGDASPTNDLGSAGSILKLIVLNCSTAEDATKYVLGDQSLSSLSLDDQSNRSTSISHAGNAFISVVHRLAASKSTSARITACSLGPVLWSHLDFPRQLQLRGVITRALHDVEVIVRKSTAAVLHEIAELVFDRRSVPWLVLMCERSMTDPEPQLRAAAMTLTWHLAEHLPNAFTGDANKGSLSIRRLPPRTDPTFMDVYLLQCKLLPVASNLAEDRIASVRLSVAAQCDRLVNAMGEHWFNIIIDLLQALLSDSDERVRSEATLCVPRFAESVILVTEENQDSTVIESLMPLALKMQRDSSPLVRSSLATAAGELLIFLVGLGGASHDAPSSPLRRRESIEAPPSPRREGSSSDETGYKRYKKHVDDTFIPILQNLLQDPDPEVTTASLRAVTNASRSSARSSASIPSCSHHKYDAGDDDLASVASHTSLQSHVSIDRTKPVFIPVLSEKQVLRLLPTLSNLATSAQWRVRQSAVEIVPALLGCTHRHETRYEISKLCLTLMGDKVDTVRRTAAECLCLGGSNLARHGEDDGGQWISNIVIPHLKTCSRSEDAKQRMLSLKMIEIIITNGLCPTRLDVIDHGEVSTCSNSSNSEVATKESAVRSILSVAASLASDSVPNVRLNVGRVLSVIVGLLDRPNAEFAVSILENQIEEERNRGKGSDRDVIYFAQQALSISRQQSSLSDLRKESSLMD